MIDAGGVCCARCGFTIVPGMRWDLDHNDLDPASYNGATHEYCNRAAGAWKRHRRRRQRVTSREW